MDLRTIILFVILIEIIVIVLLFLYKLFTKEVVIEGLTRKERKLEKIQRRRRRRRQRQREEQATAEEDVDVELVEEDEGDEGEEGPVYEEEEVEGGVENPYSGYDESTKNTLKQLDEDIENLEQMRVEIMLNSPRKF